jgi:hypothetical protein
MTITRPFFYLALMALLGGVGTSMATPVAAQSSASVSTTPVAVDALPLKATQQRVLHTHTPVVVGHHQPPAAKAAKPAIDNHYVPHVGSPIDTYRNAVTPSPVVAGR